MKQTVFLSIAMFVATSCSRRPSNGITFSFVEKAGNPVVIRMSDGNTIRAGENVYLSGHCAAYNNNRSVAGDPHAEHRLTTIEEGTASATPFMLDAIPFGTIMVAGKKTEATYVGWAHNLDSIQYTIELPKQSQAVEGMSE